MDKKIDNAEALAEHAARIVTAARQARDEGAPARKEAMEYYDGKITDMPTKKGRSAVVSMDVRSVIKKIMPSILRTVLGGGDTVKYMPVGPDDERGAEQATDYVNHVCIPESGAEAAIHDAIHDALLLKTGILKWCAYAERKVTIQEYTDQPDSAVAGLFDDPEIEIMDYEETAETDAEVLAQDPNARRHSFTLRRVSKTITPSLEAVPRGSFLISPGARDIETAELVGEEMILPRSRFVEMGYKRDMVWMLAAFDGKDEDAPEREGADHSDITQDTRKASQDVLVWDVYLRVDLDGDGIAEIYRIVFGDGRGGKTSQEGAAHIVLAVKAVSEAPYVDIVVERDPHQFEGHSVFEDVRDVQRVKTAMLRATLDNIYAQNNPKPYVNLNGVENPEAVSSGSFGEPVFLKAGTDARTVAQWLSVPFFAEKAMTMMEYMDEVARDRTGITDKSGGLDPDALQNTTATAAAIMQEAGIATADAVVKSVAKGLRKAFRGLLRLVIAHADGPRTIRMNNEWVQYDPRVWNSEMDCTVNVGLGGGTKERDMVVLQMIYNLQKEILLSMGPGAGMMYVKPEQLYNVLEKFTETAGFPSAAPYFSKPEDGAIEKTIADAAAAPNPEMVKLQAQMQLEQAKMQQSAQLEQMKAAAARDKEAAQMEADVQVKSVELEKESVARREELQAKAALAEQNLGFEREKLAVEIRMREMETEHARQMEMMKLGMRDGAEGPVSKEDDRNNSMVETLKEMMQEMSKAMTAEKEIIRDGNGDIVGSRARVN